MSIERKVSSEWSVHNELILMGIYPQKYSKLEDMELILQFANIEWV